MLEPLHVVKYNHETFVRIFTSFDWATGDIVADIMRFSKRNLGAKMIHGMLGQNCTVGQNGTGQSGTISFCPQGLFILPKCPGRFYPTPLPTTKVANTTLWPGKMKR